MPRSAKGPLARLWIIGVAAVVSALSAVGLADGAPSAGVGTHLHPGAPTSGASLVSLGGPTADVSRVLQSEVPRLRRAPVVGERRFPGASDRAVEEARALTPTGRGPLAAGTSGAAEGARVGSLRDGVTPEALLAERFAVPSRSRVAALMVAAGAGSVGRESQERQPVVASSALQGGWTSTAPPAGFYLSGPTPISCAPNTTDCVAVMNSVASPTGLGVLLTSDLTNWVGYASLPPRFMQVLGLSCPTSSRCVAVGSGPSDAPVIALSDDGGVSWADVTPAAFANAPWWPRAVDCPSSTVCYLAGGAIAPDETTIAVSQDGGSTWTLLDAAQLSACDVLFNAISCSSVTSCVAVGQTGEMGPARELFTTDGGNTWTATTSSVLLDLKAVDSVSCIRGTTTCFAVGPDESWNFFALRSDDSGASWSTAWSDAGGVVVSISCADAQHCWAAGGDASGLAGTNDGFATVSEPTTALTNQIPQISCASVDDCAAVLSGRLWSTTSGSNPGTTTTTTMSGATSSTAPGTSTSSTTSTTGPGGPPTGMSGVVTAAGTGSGVAGVCVVALSGPDFGVARTGQDGSYVITGLAAGSYGVEFDPTCAGTVSSPYAIEIDPNVVAVVEGAVTPEVNEALPLGVTITGSVNAETGATGARVDLASVCVYPFSPDAVSGEALIGAISASDGTYLLSNLPPGNYQVLFDPTCQGQQVSPYALQFWQDAADPGGATTITLGTPASGPTGIDAVLTAGASIEGTVSAPRTSDDSGVCVIAWDDEDQWPERVAVTRSDGSYTVSNLPADGYQLEFDPTCGGLQSSDFAAQLLGGGSTLALAAGAVLDGQNGTLSLLPAVSALVISSSSLPDAMSGATYSVPMQASGGDGLYGWFAAGLPTGLTMDPYTGVISGETSAIGGFPVTIFVADASTPAQAASEVVTLEVTGPPPSPSSPSPSLSGQPSALSTTTTLASTTSRASSGLAVNALVLLTSHASSPERGEVPVQLRCRRAACRGTLRLAVVHEVTVERSGHKVHRTVTTVLGTARFSLRMDSHGSVLVRLTPRGRAVLAAATGTLIVDVLITDDGVVSVRSMAIS